MSLFGNGSNTLGTTPQPQPKSGLSLGPSQAQQPPSVFAQPGSTQSQQSGNLFGTGASNQRQASGSSLFGNVTSASQPAQQSSGGSSLTLNTSATQPSVTNSLFGNSTQLRQSNNTFASSQPQQAPLFGSKPALSSTNSLFGISSAAVQPSLSMNGRTANDNRLQQQHSGPTLPGLTFGHALRQQQVVPGVRIDASNIRSTTRFHELHEDIQSQIERLDTFIQQQIQFKEQCDAMMPSHESNLKAIPEDVVLVNGLVDTSELGILNDSTSIKSAKDLLQSDADTARISFRAIETLKLPTQLRNQNIWYSNAPKRETKASMDGHDMDEFQPQDVVDYFDAEARNMTNTLHTYEKYLSDIEGHLQNVENSTIQASKRRQLILGKNSSGRSADDQIRELAAVLKEFEGGIYGVAAKIGEAQDETQRLTLQSKRRG